MATYRALHGFSLGGRGDVVAGASLVTGVDISEQEAVGLLFSGHISTPTMSNTPITAQAFLDEEAASRAWTQNVFVLTGGGFSLGVTDAAAGVTLLVSAEQEASLWAASRLAGHQNSFVITASSGTGGTVDNATSVVLWNHDATVVCTPDDDFEFDAANAEVDGDPVNEDWLATEAITGVVTLTLSEVVEEHVFTAAWSAV